MLHKIIAVAFTLTVPNRHTTNPNTAYKAIFCIDDPDLYYSCIGLGNMPNYITMEYLY